MFSGFIEKIFTKNRAPEWFCKAIKNHVPESQIKEKIRMDIKNEVIANGYDPEYWTDEFINRMALFYFKVFDQLYMQSA